MNFTSIKKRNTHFIVLLFIILLFVVRAGEYGVDYVIGDKSGRLSSPFISFSLSLFYSFTITAIFLLAFTSKIKRLAQKVPLTSERPFRIGVYVLLFLAFGMNSFLFRHNPNFGADAFSYIIPVLNFMTGKGYTIEGTVSLLSPGYGIITYLFFLVTKDIEMAAMLVSSMSYLLLILLAYRIGTILAGRPAGFLAAFFITFCPMLVKYSYLSLTDVFYMFLTACSFLVYLRIVLEKPTYVRNILLGVLFGFTFLTREESLLSGILSIAFLFYLTIKALLSHPPSTMTMIWKACSYPFATALMTSLLIFAQMHSIHAVTNSWVLSGKLYNVLAVQDQLGLDDVVSVEDTPAQALAQEAVSKKPKVSMLNYRTLPIRQLFDNTQKACQELVNITMLAIIPLLFVIWGSLLLLGKNVLMGYVPMTRITISSKTMRVVMGFGMFIAPISAPILTNLVDLRYMMQYAGFLLILAAVLMAKLLASLIPQYQRHAIAILCGISGMAALGVFEKEPNVLTPFRDYMTLMNVFHDGYGQGMRTAGIWLAQTSPYDLAQIKIIAPRKAKLILFYAHGRNQEPTGKAFSIPAHFTLADVVAIMEKEQIDYFILDRSNTPTRENLLPLWEHPENAENWQLTLVYQQPENLFQVYALQ